MGLSCSISAASMRCQAAAYEMFDSHSGYLRTARPMRQQVDVLETAFAIGSRSCGRAPSPCGCLGSRCRRCNEYRWGTAGQSLLARERPLHPDGASGAIMFGMLENIKSEIL